MSFFDLVDDAEKAKLGQLFRHGYVRELFEYAMLNLVMFFATSILLVVADDRTAVVVIGLIVGGVSIWPALLVMMWTQLNPMRSALSAFVVGWLLLLHLTVTVLTFAGGLAMNAPVIHMAMVFSELIFVLSLALFTVGLALAITKPAREAADEESAEKPLTR